jgi:hypothetical protein
MCLKAKTQTAAKGGAATFAVGVVIHLLCHEVPLVVIGLLAWAEVW